MRFNENENKFMYSSEGEAEDNQKSEQGESRNQRMARICNPAMNTINQDLQFTVECQEEHKNEWLPTLDFAVWQEKDCALNYTYYQKDMKTT